MDDVLKRIENYALEEIMGDRFGKYAKEIIQDRAIPDVRDGLKPVQRRILYAMFKAGYTHDKGYYKCAATVGDVLGKFHPHGDSSVYEAMVRMSQWWKMGHELIDIHGNNGSMDGDPAAAYRYTEAKLAKIASELLKDLDKDTVMWAPNFDDRYVEPTVLPAKYPNLLVNGTTGISAGYATNIPPHNLGEVIDATIKRIDNPNSRLESYYDIVKGPDFPTGGIIHGVSGIREALATGRGRLVIRCKYEIVKNKGKEQIIIHEIPYEVNKQMFVSKIDGIRIDKKIEGIAEVRDETDRTGLRIAIDLKSGANSDFIVNYLLKNTEMQVSYNYNNVAIVNKVPKCLGLLEILDAYIEHQRDVITKRTEFDLAFFKKRFHIVEGLIKAVSILDEVVRTIRESSNKANARENLVERFQFSVEQAEAILLLQLYKLTNTDVVVLEEEAEKLKKAIAGLEEILANEDILRQVMKHELRNVKKEYAHERKSVIDGEIVDIKIDVKEMTPLENVVVVVTHDGYVKKVSLKSFGSSSEETLLKPGDYIIGKYNTNTLETVMLFTNMGNYLFIPVHKIPDAKWKDIGKHINSVVTLAEGECIVASLMYTRNRNICLFSKNGMGKRVLSNDFEVTRFSKTMVSFKLKDTDEVTNVFYEEDAIISSTFKGNYIHYKSSEIPVVGAKASGVKSVNLNVDDYVVSVTAVSSDSEYLNVYTNNNTCKRVKLAELNVHSRAKKGSTLYKGVKTKEYNVFAAFATNMKDITLFVDDEIKEVKNSDIPIMDIASTGSTVVKSSVNFIVLKKNLEDMIEVVGNDDVSDTKEVEVADNIISEVDEKKVVHQMSLDDFTKDFKI